MYQRRILLDFDMSKYECCGGTLCDCRKCTDPCPSFCLCLEAFCCMWFGIYANRYYVQVKYDIRNSCFDEFLIMLACIYSIIICILRCFIDIPDTIERIIDLIYCMFAGCLQSQQQHEIEKHTGISGG